MTATVTLPCKCCQRDQPHEVIPSMSPGNVYFACKTCGTVQHQRRTFEEKSS